VITTEQMIGRLGVGAGNHAGAAEILSPNLCPLLAGFSQARALGVLYLPGCADVGGSTFTSLLSMDIFASQARYSRVYLGAATSGGGLWRAIPASCRGWRNGHPVAVWFALHVLVRTRASHGGISCCIRA